MKKPKFNKAQIKHLSGVIDAVAKYQFLFFLGKEAYLFSIKNKADLLLLGLSAAIFIGFHVIEHFLLGYLGDDKSE